MHLTLLQDASPLTHSGIDHLTIGVADMPATLHQLRNAFADHRTLAALPGWEIVVGEGVTESQLLTVENRLSELISDIGNSPLDSWWGAKNAIANSIRCSTDLKHADLIGSCAGVPAIVIASGPSASKHVEWIKRNQSNAVVIVADSSFVKAASAGINADFVTILERDPCMSKLVPPDVSPDTILCCPPVVAPECISDRRTVWWWQSTESLYSWIGPNIPQQASGRSAGTLAISLAGALGCSPIILVGHDLAYADGASHSALADPMAHENHANAAGMDADQLHQAEKCIGDHGQTLGTCRFWQLARMDIEAFSSDNPGKIHKMGSDGAAIQGVLSTDFGDLESISFTFDPPKNTKYPSKCMDYLGEPLMSDLSGLVRRMELPKGTRQEFIHAMQNMDPKEWASHRTRGLHAYVLGTIYHAATLRMFLQQSDPDAAIAASWRLLKRGLTTMVARMIRECP